MTHKTIKTRWNTKILTGYDNLCQQEGSKNTDLGLFKTTYFRIRSGLGGADHEVTIKSS